MAEATIFCVVVCRGGYPIGLRSRESVSKRLDFVRFLRCNGLAERPRPQSNGAIFAVSNRAPKTCSRVVLTAEEAKRVADGSNPDAKFNYEYMRIWWKDTKLVTAGFLAELPAKKDKPVVKLYAACELIIKPDFGGEFVYGTYTSDITQFVDLSNPNILLIEVVHKNPCAPLKGI